MSGGEEEPRGGGGSSGGGRPSVLLGLAGLLGEPADVELLLARIASLVSRAVNADRSAVFLVDRGRKELRARAAHLAPDEIRLPIGQGIAGRAAETATAIAVPALGHDAGFTFAEAIDETTGKPSASVLAVPVFERGGASGGRGEGPGRRVVGVIVALDKRSAAAFDDADRAAVEALAEPIGEALALAHLDEIDDRPVRYNGMVGASPAMRVVYDRMDSAAATDATVLVVGENGTGKGLVARAIHASGARAQGPFVELDCAAVPETLIEAELVGHEKDAFAGADLLVVGKAERAAGGTLFLDHIDGAPLSLQARLLRLVQDRVLERIGGHRAIQPDVRLVAATHRDLDEAVRRGGFRRDLLERIGAVTVALPPLRERGGDDIARLARHFLRLHARCHGRAARSIDPLAMSVLRSYSWPGNIRELDHAIESAVVLCRGPALLLSHVSLPRPSAGEPERDAAVADGGVALTLAEVEKRHILATLDAVAGNRTRAAAVLEIGRNTLARKLKQYGID